MRRLDCLLGRCSVYSCVLTLKRSPMTRVNDVIYFHSVVCVWFVKWTVPKQIPVTSAAQTQHWEDNPTSTAQWDVLESSPGPGEDWTGAPLS